MGSVSPIRSPFDSQIDYRCGMTKSMQLAVRLDDELTDRLDWLSQHLGIASHGKIVRLAIEELVKAERQRANED